MASRFLHLEEAFLPRRRRRDALDGPEYQSDRNPEPAELDLHVAVFKVESPTASVGLPVIRAQKRRRKRSIS